MGNFKPHSQKTKEIISEKLKEYFKTHKSWNEGTKGLTKSNKGSFKKGLIPWNKGIPMSKESKIKYLKSMKGKYGRYINISKTEAITKTLKQQKMSPPELFLNNLIKTNNLPFRYVGDGSYWVEGKKGKYGRDEVYNPDFISLDKKKIIEVFSRWHKTLASKVAKDIKRKECYKKKGYKFIIFNERELVPKNTQIILNKIGGLK